MRPALGYVAGNADKGLESLDDAVHGILGKTPEDTIRNMGLIASPGMVQTEQTIVEILQKK